MKQKTFFLTAEQSFNSAKRRKTLASILKASTVGCLYIDPCDTFAQNVLNIGYNTSQQTHTHINGKIRHSKPSNIK